MDFKEVNAHDYLMNGIIYFFPEKYTEECFHLDKEIFKDVNLEKLPKMKSPFLDIEDIFGEKGFALLNPEHFHIRIE